MRSIWRLAGVLVFLNHAMTAYAADGAGQDSNSSPLLWLMLFLPASVLIFFVFAVRKSRAMQVNSLKRFDEHRKFSEAHMQRLESQIESLDKKLTRMIELLGAIEKGQKREHT